MAEATINLEDEVGRLAVSAVKQAADATKENDIAFIGGYLMNVIFEANIRMRGEHRVSGQDFATCLQLLEYLTAGRKGNGRSQ